MYNFFIFLYNIGVWVATLFSRKVRTMWKGEHETFRILKEKVEPNTKYIWFHAASLGEFEQGRPLMEQLRKERAGYKILLTFFSPSGYEVRKNYSGADIICYLPIDTIGNARRFLRTVRPVMAFFIKYEFWSNYLHVLKHRGVPLYSVSSIFRHDQIFFRWYGRGYGRVLDCFTHFFVQNEESRRLLASIGIDRATVTGDTRFDRVLQIKEAGKSLSIVETFLGLERSNHNSQSSTLNPQHSPVFIAGSSWPPDEDIFIRYFNEHREWKLIIAPHIIGEDHLKQILSKLQHKTVRYTEATEENVRHAECLIIDCFGLLSSIYRYADVTYVGGGFGVGIHNVLEAAVWGKPVLFGPNNKNFQEAQGLLRSGGGFEISDVNGFADLMRRLEIDKHFLEQSSKAAGDYVSSLTGATQMIMKSIK
ncbi:3-deoxy-D-manno-octulosonic acid transferase [Hallella multisaccharivorax]|uniref:3-deoxy-D-manno-octulosonic acid transferase n=1 Tax=Hallella multisaccharivorax TaxID=310514 RepID=UPI00360AD1E2